MFLNNAITVFFGSKFFIHFFLNKNDIEVWFAVFNLKMFHNTKNIFSMFIKMFMQTAHKNLWKNPKKPKKIDK